MNIPKIKFRPMSLIENIELIKWAFYENNGSLDIHYYIIKYFPSLATITSNDSKEKIFKLIEELVTRDYIQYEEKIKSESKRYNEIWESYNDDYFKEISRYLNIEWPDSINVIDASVGLTPIFPRLLDSHSFYISTNLDDSKLTRICAHETCHFLWFEKWKKLYPECSIREFDSPYLPWQYSEMVTDPILNSSEINQILHISEEAYSSFYEINDGNLMKHLKEIYDTDDSIESKIINGYEYVKNNIEESEIIE